jgi:hypothetical protein
MQKQVLQGHTRKVIIFVYSDSLFGPIPGKQNMKTAAGLLNKQNI